MRLVNRGVAPIGRAAVSKTACCEFESPHPCQIKKKPSNSSAFWHMAFNQLIHILALLTVPRPPGYI